MNTFIKQCTFAEYCYLKIVTNLRFKTMECKNYVWSKCSDFEVNLWDRTLRIVKKKGAICLFQIVINFPAVENLFIRHFYFIILITNPLISIYLGRMIRNIVLFKKSINKLRQQSVLLLIVWDNQVCSVF